jgi:branched-chain amino acid transport system ATP-binding protein
MDEHAKHLSYGQRKLLEIGRALATGAPNLFLDEPFAGLFPEMIERVKEIIREEKTRGASIVLIEHDMSVIRELCNRIIVLDAGKVIAEGDAEETLRDPNVVEAYLGE